LFLSGTSQSAHFKIHFLNTLSYHALIKREIFIDQEPRDGPILDNGDYKEREREREREREISHKNVILPVPQKQLLA